MQKCLILNDTSDHDNWGSQACIDGLKAILESSLGEVEFISLPSRWIARHYWHLDLPIIRRKVFHERVRWIPGRLWRHFEILPKVADQFEWFAQKWMEGACNPAVAEYLCCLREVDLVVFNAEGATYRNNWTAMKSIFMLWLAKTYFDKFSFFLNGSVTITTVDRILPGFLRRCFPTLDGITIREPVSYRNLVDYMPNVRAEMVPDSVFYLIRYVDSLDERRARSPILNELRGRSYFCFSLSMLPMDYRPGAKEGALRTLIERVSRATRCIAVLIAKDRTDLFLKDLAREIGCVYLGPEHTYWQAVEVLRGARFLISGRYHHVIFASLVGCPSITLTTTSHKMEGLLELLGPVAYGPYDATDVGRHIEEIVEHARRLMQGSDRLRGAIRKVTRELGEQTLRMGEVVREAIGRG